METGLVAVSAGCRRSAAARRADVLEAAVFAFGTGGLHGTSTEAIAERAGISQPYLFKLFASKKGLFLATLELAFARTHESLCQAFGGQEGEMVDPDEAGIGGLFGGRDVMLVLLQGHAAACGDDDIREALQRELARLAAAVERFTGWSAGDAHGLVGGLLLAAAREAITPPHSRALLRT
jgi:AcrR family transcriptional regulator